MLGRQNVSPTLQQQVNHSSQQRASLFQQTWKVFCASFWNHVDLLPKQPASKSGCLHKWSDLLMFPRTEQRIVVLKCVLLLLHCLYTFPVAPSTALGIFHRSNRNIPAATQSGLLTGCNSVPRSKNSLTRCAGHDLRLPTLCTVKSLFDATKHQLIIPRTLQNHLEWEHFKKATFRITTKVQGSSSSPQLRRQNRNGKT